MQSLEALFLLARHNFSQFLQDLLTVAELAASIAFTIFSAYLFSIGAAPAVQILLLTYLAATLHNLVPALQPLGV
ncbi:MAG: hypothetical protein WC371_02225 [Parachlamydiales bacterium]